MRHSGVRAQARDQVPVQRWACLGVPPRSPVVPTRSLELKIDCWNIQRWADSVCPYVVRWFQQAAWS